jgi:hypothetical protein
MENQHTAIAQRSLHKIHFDHKDMDHHLSALKCAIKTSRSLVTCGV